MTRSMSQAYYRVDILDMAAQKLLLEEFLVKQSNINTRDNQGRNTLYWAIYHKSRHNARLLLKYGSSLKVASKWQRSVIKLVKEVHHVIRRV